MRVFERFYLISAFWAVLSIAAPAAAQEEKATGMADAPENRIVITTVYDNYAADPHLATRWGFAAVVATPQGTVLFDTGGDSSVLLTNLKALGIAPGSIRAIVISHIHRDHLGGLKGFLAQNRDVMVYIPASFPDAVRRMIRTAGAGVRDVTGPTKIIPGVFTAGPWGNGVDEQALVVGTDRGLVVMTGCAHPGIVRLVEAAHADHPDRPIALVMGGFHLSSATTARIADIVEAFRRLGVRTLAPSHCTGDAARSLFWKAYGKDFIEGGVGMVLRFAPMMGPAVK